jgi:hypothetical protein
MATIVPGYDFGVREVPTVETMLRQANGLKISGITVAELDAGIAGIKSGDDSGTTDALRTSDTVGTLWVSMKGDVWVQEQAGPVILNRIEYGWETLRLHLEIQANPVDHRRIGVTVQQGGGFGVWEDLRRVEGLATRHSGIPSLNVSNAGSYNNARGGDHWGCIQGDTATSPGRHQRVAFRGLIQYSDRETAGSTLSKESEMCLSQRLKSPQATTSIPHMQAFNFGTSSNLGGWKYFGWVGSPSPSSSKLSNGAGQLGADYKQDFMMWAFGYMSYTNQQAGP